MLACSSKSAAGKAQIHSARACSEVKIPEDFGLEPERPGRHSSPASPDGRAGSGPGSVWVCGPLVPLHGQAKFTNHRKKIVASGLVICVFSSAMGMTPKSASDLRIS